MSSILSAIYNSKLDLAKQEKKNYEDSKAFFKSEKTRLSLIASKKAYTDDKTIPGFNHIGNIKANASSILDYAVQQIGGGQSSGDVWYGPDKNLLIIAFKGTDNANDLIADLGIMDKIRGSGSDFKEGKGKVHSGFYKTMKGMKTELDDIIANYPQAEILITGHSLGGAVAELYGQTIDKDNVEIISIGAPQIGDQEFKENFSKPLFRIVHNADIIITGNFGYVHPSNNVYEVGLSSDAAFSSLKFHGLDKYEALIFRFDDEDFKRKFDSDNIKYSHDATVQVLNFTKKALSAFEVYLVLDDLYKNYSHVFLIFTEVDNALSTFFHTHFGKSEIMDELKTYLQKVYIENSDPKLVEGMIKNVKRDVAQATKTSVKGIDKTKAALNNLDVQESWLMSKLTTGYDNMFGSLDELEFKFFSNVEGEAFRQEQELVKFIEKKKIEMKNKKFIPSPLREIFEKRIDSIVEKQGEKIAKTIRRGKIQQLDKITESIHWIGKTRADFENTGWLINEPRDVFVQTPFHGTEGHKLGVAYREADEMLIFSFPPATSQADKSSAIAGLVKFKEGQEGKVPFRYGKGKVHGGFQSMYDAFHEEMKLVLDEMGDIPFKKVHFTGHSMGGTMAQFALGDDLFKNVEKSAVLFGAPPIGDKEFVKSIDQTANIKHFFHRFDPVPRIFASRFNKIRATEIDLYKSGDVFSKDLSGKMSDLYHRENGFEKMIGRFTTPDDTMAIIEQSPFSKMNNKIKEFVKNNDFLKNINPTAIDLDISQKFKKVWGPIVSSKSFIIQNIRFTKAKLAEKILKLLDKNIIEISELDELVEITTTDLDESIHLYQEFGDEADEIPTKTKSIKTNNYVDVDAVDFSVDELPEIKERISKPYTTTAKGTRLKLNKNGVIEEWFEFAEDSELFDDIGKTKLDEILDAMKLSKSNFKIPSIKLGKELAKKLKGANSFVKKSLLKQLRKNLAKFAKNSKLLGKNISRNLGIIGAGVDVGFTINDILSELNTKKMEEGTITFKGKERNAFIDFAGERIYHTYEPEAFNQVLTLKLLYAKLAKTGQIPKDISPDSFAITWMGRLSEDKDGNLLVDGKPIAQVDMNVEYNHVSNGRVDVRPSRSSEGIVTWNLSKFFLSTVMTMGPQAVVGIPVAIGLGIADDIDKEDMKEFRSNAFGRAMENAIGLRIAHRVYKEFTKNLKIKLTDQEQNELFQNIYMDLRGEKPEGTSLRSEAGGFGLDILATVAGVDLRFKEKFAERRNKFFSAYGLTDQWNKFKESTAQPWINETRTDPMNALVRISNWENKTNIMERIKEINSKLGGDPNQRPTTRIAKYENIGKTFRYAVFEDNQLKIKTIKLTHEIWKKISSLESDKVYLEGVLKSLKRSLLRAAEFNAMDDVNEITKRITELQKRLDKNLQDMDSYVQSNIKYSTEAYFTWKYYEKRYPQLKVSLDVNDKLVFLPKSSNKSSVMATDPSNMIDVISQVELARSEFPEYEIKLDGKGGWIAIDQDGNPATEQVKDRVGLLNQIEYLKTQFPDYEFEIKDNQWVATKDGKDKSIELLVELYQKENPEYDVKINKDRTPSFFKNGHDVTIQLQEMEYFKTNYENISFEISEETGLWVASIDDKIIKRQDIYFYDYIKTNFPDIDVYFEGDTLKAFLDDKDVVKNITKQYYYQSKYGKDYSIELVNGELVVRDKQKNDITKHIGTIDYVKEHYPDATVVIEKDTLRIESDPLYKLKDGTILRKNQFDSLVKSGNLKPESAIELPGHDITDLVKRIEYFKRILSDVEFEIVNKNNPIDVEQESEIKAFDKDGKSIDYRKTIAEKMGIENVDNDEELLKRISARVKTPSGVSNMLPDNEQPFEELKDITPDSQSTTMEDFTPTGKPLRTGFSNNKYFIELEDLRILPYNGNTNTVYRNNYGNWIGSLPNANSLPISTLDGYFMAFHVESQMEEFVYDQILERLKNRITTAIQIGTLSIDQNVEEFSLATKILQEIKTKKSLRTIDTLIESENTNIVLETSILESFTPSRQGTVPIGVNVPSNMNIEDSPTNPLKRAIEVADQIGDSLMYKKFKKIEKDYQEFWGISQQYLTSAKQAQQGSKPSSLDRTILEQSVLGETLEEFLAKQIKLNLSRPLHNGS